MESNDKNQKSKTEILKEKIKLKEDYLKKIQIKLSSKSKEIQEIEELLKKLGPCKLFTKKELEYLKNKKFKEISEKEAEEKLNINLKTKKSFEEAKNIRLKIINKNEEEKLELETLASSIEKKALEHQIKILKIILKEKNESYENLLVQKICEECNFKKNKEDKNKKSLKIRNLNFICLNIKKDIFDIYFKIQKSSSMLKSYSVV